MADRVLLGKNEAGVSGIWVSKPGANVVALAGNTYLQSLSRWYGYQEEFDGDGTDGSFAISDPLSEFVLHSSPSGEAVRRTKNGTLIYTGADGGEGRALLSKLNNNPAAAHAPGPGSFIGSDYPIVEMRIRMLHDPVLQEVGGFNLYLYNAVIGATSSVDNIWPGKAGTGGGNLTIHGGNYKNVFYDGETPLLNVWKILEWDMSNIAAWMDPYLFHDSSGPYSSQYRITRLRFDINGPDAVEAVWTPTTDPMWEIDYVRVKKKSIPAEAGRYGNSQDAMLFDSDVNRMGVVHQTGIVTIGTAKALINGNTSNRVVGHNVDNDANGYVSFPELDYIPLVLFQRIDENADVTGVSYPEGRDEYSICTQKWEDNRYPTLDMNTSEPSWKRFDIQMVNYGPKGSFSSGDRSMQDDIFSYNLQHWSYLNNHVNNHEIWDELVTLEPDSHVVSSLENFYVATSDSISGGGPAFADWHISAPGPLSSLEITDFNSLKGDGFALPWDVAGSGAVSFPAWGNTSSLLDSDGISARSTTTDTLGNEILPPVTWDSMASTFNETRTFAYARAKKDGFWLTCRNAIAQEGMEPALNLAPVFPEEGTANQGFAAYTSMASNNDNGSWGMFHPALTLYDTGDGNGPQKFTEGLQLKWNTITTANSVLLDKVGEDEIGNFYTQYKWWPGFSCSGLIFDGARARPSDDISNVPKEDYPLSYTGIPVNTSAMGSVLMTTKNEYALDAMYSTEGNGILKGDTGGFYPHRYQYNHMYHEHRTSHPNGHTFNTPSRGLPGATILHPPDTGAAGLPPSITEAGGKLRWRIPQYNIKRLSSLGIIHPEGTVPRDLEAYSNRQLKILGTDEIPTQTGYIGGAMNKKTGVVASYDKTLAHASRYRYWVLRIPVSIPEYTS